MPKSDPVRERRIDFEILVDCYDDHEVNTAWQIYFEEQLTFPFAATALLDRRGKAPEKKRVEVVAVDPAAGGDRRVRLGIVEEGSERVQYVDPSDIVAVHDDDNRERLNDWRYWMDLELLK